MIKQLITPREKDMGDFAVRRLLPNSQQPMVGPWIFFDHFGPSVFPAGKGVDVRPHPHINLATVTYLFTGEILHRDSLGSYQTIVPGDINLMVAGKGIVHSERERPEIRDQEHFLHGLQLWLALPEAEEEIEPAFYHYPAEDIPAVKVDEADIRLMMGEVYDITSPVKTYSSTLYMEAYLKAGLFLMLPKNIPEMALYVAEGSITLAGSIIKAGTMAILQPYAYDSVQANTNSRIAIIGGEPLGKRYIEWNFVSSRQDRIEQAKADWVKGLFPKVPGDEEEYIPLP